MRTIKFRGKEIYGGSWVYDESYRKTNVGVEIGDMDVDPETVGQFTGLTDKNGKEIYEGDIVFYLGKSVVGYVINSFFPFDYTEPSYVKVIGNIHDNPELLESK